MTASTAASTAFYCVSDSRYFLGAVAMINSLRLQGHEERIFLLDCGLEADQRELLAGQVTLVDAPRKTAPQLLKSVAPLAHPAATMVLIDVDMIVTRPLGELIDRPLGGMAIAFANNVERWDERWGELLGLGELERRPYLCSGFVAIDGRLAERVLERMERAASAVDFSRTFWRANEDGYPFLYADQDLLNAVLAAEADSREVAVLDHRLAPGTPFDGLELVDAATLRCVHADGTEPYLLHHILPTKPWLASMPYGIYSQLMKRALTASDVAVSVPERAIPLRLRDGAAARAERGRIAARDRLAWFARDRLPESWMRRVDRARGGGSAA